MNDDAVILDQADEEALIYDVSDEALEAAAGKSIPLPARSAQYCTVTLPFGGPCQDIDP